MSMHSIVQLAGRWLSFGQDSVAISETRPRLEGPPWLFAEFEGGNSGVMSLEGSSAHAVALIEKRLRADGLIDGDAKILIHKNRSMGAGYQTLYTAVPLDTWQQSYAWAEAQPDHCLLLPITSLMWRTLKPGEGLIVHCGRQMSVLALRKHDIIHRASMAYSEDPSDLSMTASALAQQVADDLSRSDEERDPLLFRWCSLLLPASEAEQTPLNERLAEIFSIATGSQVKQVPMHIYRDEHGQSWSSGIAWMRTQASSRDAVNPLPSRAAYLAEWALPMASAASLVIAIALGALGTRWMLAAHDANERSEAISQEISTLEQEARLLADKANMPAGLDGALQFVSKAKALTDGIDPVTGLESVRRAAQDEVRILRVRVEQPAPGQANAGPPRTLRVDGMVDADRGTPGMQIAAFVERLRQEGFDPVPLDPQSGGATRAGGGVFSYLLKTTTPTSADAVTEPTT